MTLARVIEALLFSAQKPLSIRELTEAIRGAGAEDEFSQAHITEKGFGRMGGEDTKAVGHVTMGSPNLFEGGINGV